MSATRDKVNSEIAVVNSSTFGFYFPELMEQLEGMGSVSRFNFDSDIPGKDLAEKLTGVDYVIASVTPTFSADFFRENDDVKLIARHGIGCDNVDLDAATDAGVVVTRVGGEFERDAVAELTVALMMTCIRDVIPAARAVERSQWPRRKEFVGLELSGMEVGIVGYGNIGSRVAEIVQNGFGAEVSAYDPNIASPVIRNTGVRPVGFEEVLSNSDLLSFNASLNSENYHFIGEDEFNLMKDGVIIVNTARGELLERPAFVEALTSGKVRCAGTDVLEQEPPGEDNPLRSLDNFYILPHVGSYTEKSLRAMDEKMVEDVKDILKEEIPRELVNPKVLRKKNRAGISL